MWDVGVEQITVWAEWTSLNMFFNYGPFKMCLEITYCWELNLWLKKSSRKQCEHSVKIEEVKQWNIMKLMKMQCCFICLFFFQPKMQVHPTAGILSSFR